MKWTAFFSVISVVFCQGDMSAQIALSPDYSEVYAEGPFTGRIDYLPKFADLEAKPLFHNQARILFVTNRAVYFQEKAGDATRSISVEQCRGMQISAQVTNPGGKLVTYMWQLNDKNPMEKVLEPSDKKQPNVQIQQKPVASVVKEPLNLDDLHYSCLVRLSQRVNAALLAGDASLLEGLAKQAKLRNIYLKNIKGDEQVRKLYSTLPEYIENQLMLSKRSKELIQKSKDANAKAFADRQEAFAKKNQSLQVGLLSGLLGAIANGSTTSYLWSDGSKTREFEPDYLTGVLTFSNTALKAGLNYQQQIGAINSSFSVLDEKLRKEYEATINKYVKDRESRTRQLSDLGHKTERTSRLQSEPTAKTYLAEIEQEIKRGPHCDIFHLADLYFEQALRISILDKDAAERIYKYAQQIELLVSWLPRNKEYNNERLELTALAVRLYCRTATVETSTKSWHKLYSPRAAYSVRLLDSYSNLDELDVTGEFRQLRGMALFMLGQAESASEQLRSLQTISKKSADYHVMMARAIALQAIHVGTTTDLELIRKKTMSERELEVFNKLEADERRNAAKIQKQIYAEVCDELEMAIQCGLKDPVAVNTTSELSATQRYQKSRYEKILKDIKDKSR